MEGIRRGFTLWKKKGVRFLTVPSFERVGNVLCAFSTRIGGVSPKPFDTLNLSRNRENSEANFRENMSRFANAVNFNMNLAVANKYEHGTAMHKAIKEDAGCGIVRAALEDHCDGLATNEAGLPLLTYHADCVPLVFFDPAARTAAICHAGWRGVMGHMVREAVASLEALGSIPENILAAVGPCISVKHFQVREDVYLPFAETFGDGVLQKRDGSVYADLPAACAMDMAAAGLKEENITLSDLCTYENKRLFYSYRREAGQTGAMAAVIELRE